MRTPSYLACLSVLSASAVTIVFGCGVRQHGDRPDAGPSDSGEADAASNYDPVLGSPFDEPIELDDERVMAVDPMTLAGGARPCRAPILARISRIIDGDTVFANGVSEPISVRVRMIGVDTPEVAHRDSGAECYGNEARDFTELLLDRLVWLTFDRTCMDPYDRLLAYVHIGGGPRDIWERQLLRRGLARVLVIEPNSAFEDVLFSDEREAANDRAGLWAGCP